MITLEIKKTLNIFWYFMLDTLTHIQFAFNRTLFNLTGICSFRNKLRIESTSYILYHLGLIKKELK